ncbi:MAG: holo-ACP synthase [Desulfovibrio sp.]|nr:holo-ACP synthase [Desulfovibrio sp.]
MIIGIGCDIVETDRIAHSIECFGTHFLQKVYTEGERQSVHGNTAQYFAARFAAKEAVVKALGTGFTRGIAMTDISVLNTREGAPSLVFFGKAKEILAELGVCKSFLSISHEKKYCIAYVVLEG